MYKRNRKIWALALFIFFCCIGSLVVLRHIRKPLPAVKVHKPVQSNTKAQMPAPDESVIEGHWQADGTWHAETHKTQEEQTETFTKTEGRHPHDSLSDEEHAEVHRQEQERMRKEIAFLKQDIARMKAEMAEEAKAYKERKEIEALIPEYEERFSKYKDLMAFFSTTPSRAEVLKRYPTRETQEALWANFSDFQMICNELYTQISTRETFAKQVWTEYPEFMADLKHLISLEVSDIYLGGVK